MDSENWVNKIHTIGSYLQLVYFGKAKISHYWKFAANQKIKLFKDKQLSFFKKWLSKIQFQFIFEQQCFTQTDKKINNFIDKKSGKNKPFIFDLYNHLIKLLRVQLSTYTEKVTSILGIRLLFLLLLCFFFSPLKL